MSSVNKIYEINFESKHHSLIVKFNIVLTRVGTALGFPLGSRWLILRFYKINYINYCFLMYIYIYIYTLGKTIIFYDIYIYIY